jgi:hypothetical protein
LNTEVSNGVAVGRGSIDADALPCGVVSVLEAIQAESFVNTALET